MPIDIFSPAAFQAIGLPNLSSPIGVRYGAVIVTDAAGATVDYCAAIELPGLTPRHSRGALEVPRAAVHADALKFAVGALARFCAGFVGESRALLDGTAFHFYGPSAAGSECVPLRVRTQGVAFWAIGPSAETWSAIGCEVLDVRPNVPETWDDSKDDAENRETARLAESSAFAERDARIGFGSFGDIDARDVQLIFGDG